MYKFPRRTAFRTGLKLLFVAAGLVLIQAVVTGGPSDAAVEEAVSTRHDLVAAPGFGLSDFAAFPNPARTSSRFRYRLNQAVESVQIKIFDQAGRHVRTLDGPVGVGVQNSDWDLTNGQGFGIGNGVYLAEIRVSGGGRTTRDRFRVAVMR